MNVYVDIPMCVFPHIDSFVLTAKSSQTNVRYLLPGIGTVVALLFTTVSVFLPCLDEALARYLLQNRTKCVIPPRLNTRTYKMHMQTRSTIEV